jgi:hypothetical protein
VEALASKRNGNVCRITTSCERYIFDLHFKAEREMRIDVFTFGMRIKFVAFQENVLRCLPDA